MEELEKADVSDLGLLQYLNRSSATRDASNSLLSQQACYTSLGKHDVHSVVAELVSAVDADKAETSSATTEEGSRSSESTDAVEHGRSKHRYAATTLPKSTDAL